MWQKQYLYLKKQINSSGQIIDPLLKSPLDFQYHYGSFALSSLLLGDFEKSGEKVLQYLLQVPAEISDTSSEFNNFFLLNALKLDSSGILNPFKERISGFIRHRSDSELNNLNYNFRYLRFLNRIIELQVLGRGNEEKIKSEKKWLLANQFSDGFFPDSQILADEKIGEGVPHLVYNAKILMTLSYAWYLTGEQELLESFLFGLDALMEVGDFHLNYGRSTNSIFGFSSFYFALGMAFIASGNKKYDDFRLEINALFSRLQQPDGHLLINLTDDEKRRPGFDGYMYLIVYNCYAGAICLLADHLADSNDSSIIKNIEQSKPVCEDKIQYYRTSGFVKYFFGQSSYLFNIGGHQSSYKHRNDARVSPFSLISWKRNGDEIMPGMGFSPQPLHQQVEKKQLWKSIISYYFKMRNYKWLPLLSGNNFFYRRHDVFYYPYAPIRIIRLGDDFFCKFLAMSRSKTGRAAKKDYFVIHFAPDSSQLQISIQWYEQVDELFYSFRHSLGREVLDYEFNTTIRILSPISFPTSNGYCKLERVRIRKPEKLKIRIFEK